MKIQYDKKANAAYIYFQKNGKKKVAKTTPLNDFLLIDTDKKGKIYGIEILDASKHIPVGPIRSSKKTSRQ